ncbi:(d)CMP kinase [Thermospira aquatica]|uniref:Cytidylate kinase n=1 Tax=Thermospira aquatica TaxID=2828656 RepID=A0AAX3BD45_9SPIR|nr:(d)CMP kinase [Thermospira aquatica]URA10205.1 (d)CMP kinase [Thermospira aquatica]
MIITIDGPAGSGKSTMAKRLAKRLGFGFLNTGAMYRAVTLYFLRRRVDISNQDMVNSLLPDIHLEFSGERLFLNGEDVSEEIRLPEVERFVSAVSALPEVRQRMVELQREIARKGNYVLEGRDTGTVVFPDAFCKFYLDASVEERARRRQKELAEKGFSYEFTELVQEIERRDYLDKNREIAPLIKPEDAVVVDTSSLTPDEVEEKLYHEVKKKMEQRG